MEAAIQKLNEYRDWVIENEHLVYWTSEEEIQDAINVLESNKTAEEFCLEQI